MLQNEGFEDGFSSFLKQQFVRTKLENLERKKIYKILNVLPGSHMTEANFSTSN